jgi:hypothetical protein
VRVVSLGYACPGGQPGSGGPPLRVHPFETPITAADEPAPSRISRGRERPCSCALSPFCRGQASQDWAVCSTSCASCAPTPWKAPSRTPVVVDGLDS